MRIRRVPISWLALALAGGACGQARAALRPLPATSLEALQARQAARVSQVTERMASRLKALKLDARHSIQPGRAHTDAYGQLHTRFQQLFQGIPVWGAVAIHHMDADGTERPLTDTLQRKIEVDTTPQVQPSEALAIVEQALKPRGAFAQAPESGLVIYPVTRLQPRAGARVTQLNAADMERKVLRHALAYHVHTELENSEDGIRHTDYLVDAHTGEVLRSWDSLQTTADTGSGNSQYSGTVTLNTNRLPDGTWELRDLTRGALPHPLTGVTGNAVYNYNHGSTSSYSTFGTLYTDADDTWGDGQNYVAAGPTDGANGQTAAVDAAFGLQKTWDYYLNIHGRMGIDGLGRSTLLRIHTGTTYDNAFWSDRCFCMSYGDGSGKANGGFDAVTCLDVAGHEMSHGVTSTSAALVYSGESGALNEANSDIHGTMVECYSRSTDATRIGDIGGNWTIGEQIGNTPLRYMYRPDLDGSSPNYWFPSIGYLDVHYSSGPMNRAFAFLSHGAEATGDWSTAVNTARYDVTSPNFLPMGMPGIGNDRAAAIWFRALTVYLTPNASYVEARRAAEQSAMDLFGAGSMEVAAVQNAFAAINVGVPAATPLDALAPSNVTASLSGGPSGNLTFTATATDNVAVSRLDFFVDGARMGGGVFSSGTWSLTLPSNAFLNGAHTMVAKAYDAAFNEAVSPGVFFNTVNSSYQPLLNGGFERGLDGWETAWPYLSSIAHSGSAALAFGGYGVVNSDVAYQPVLIPANATSLTLSYWFRMDTTSTATTNVDKFRCYLLNSALSAYYLASPYATPSTTTPGTWSQVTLTATSSVLNAIKGKVVYPYFFHIEDGANATRFLLDDVVVDIGQPAPADSIAPVVTASSVTGSSGNVTFDAAATDDVGVTRVDFRVDGTLVASASAAPYTATLDSLALGNGPHTLQAIAYDAAGNAGAGTISAFSISNILPAGILLERENNDTLLTANFVPTSVSTIQGELDGLSDIDHFAFALAPGQTLSLDMTGPAGSDYDLYLVDGSSARLAASQNNGSTEHLSYTNMSAQTLLLYARVLPYASPSATLPYFLKPTWTADTTAPTVSVAIDGTGDSLTFTATVSDLGSVVSRVDFLVDGLPRGSAITAPYTLAFDASGLAGGVHSLVARATDVAGNVASSTPLSFSTAAAADASITSVDVLTRGFPGVATVPVQAGATYAWTLSGGTINGAANGSQVAFTAGAGDSMTLSVTVTNALGAAATTSKVLSLTPVNLDLDQDAAAGPLDLGVFVKAFGTRRGDAAFNAAADLNGDGAVNDADISIFLNAFGR